MAGATKFAESKPQPVENLYVSKHIITTVLSQAAINVEFAMADSCHRPSAGWRMALYKHNSTPAQAIGLPSNLLTS